jgi:hypothetical protein
MGLLDVLKGRRQAAPTAPICLRLETCDWTTESLDGEQLLGRGFMLRDENDRAVSFSDERLAQALVAKTAGISHRLDVAQRPAFNPGQRLTLIRDPKNPYDKNAVGIFDAERRMQVGFLPRDVAMTVAPRLDRGERLEAFSLWEWRKDDGQRVALRAFVGPSWMVEMLLGNAR